MEELKQIKLAIQSLPNSEKKVLVSLLDSLANLVTDANLSDNERTQLLSEIAKYLKRKKVRPISYVDDELEYLRYVRNSIVHSNKVPEEAIRIAIPIFWRVMREKSTEWEWQKFSNLLAYSMRYKTSMPSKNYSNSISPKMQLRKYEEFFNRMSSEDKEIIFRDLLLSISSTPEFQNILKKPRLKQQKEHNNV